jgi:hypothetical protein
MKDSLALIVQDAEESVGLGLVELETARVVDKLDVDPVDAFALVLLLLVLENVLVEVVLQVLVGVVNAELLETVTDKDNNRREELGRPIRFFSFLFFPVAVPASRQGQSLSFSVSLSDLSFFSVSVSPVHVAEIFKAEDVEDPNRVGPLHFVDVFLGQQGMVQLHDDPVKQ